MKILQIGKFYPIKGGVERVMYDLMVGLSERGYDCDMLCAGHDGYKGSYTINNHARLICCKTLVKLAATMISPAMIFKAYKICSDYDIIHIHHPDPMAAFALFLSGYKGRVILHWHSDILKQKKLLKLYKPLQDWLIRRADTIIGTSPVYLAESPFLQHVQHKTFCMPIGIDPLSPNPAKVADLNNQYPSKRIIFSLGRLVEYKGFKYLIEAARHLSDDYVILIGGTGPLRQQHENEIAMMGLKDKVKLIGYVPDEDLPTYFGTCSVFCLPSVFKTEAFGIVQLEAMSCGKPIVATKIPGSGTHWVNDHGNSGINVPIADAKALADAITNITSDQTTYLNYSANAVMRYQNIFTKSRMIDMCIDLYITKK